MLARDQMQYDSIEPIVQDESKFSNGLILDFFLFQIPE